MLAILLAMAVTLSGQRPVEVDVIEYNRYGTPGGQRDQLLLRRWTRGPYGPANHVAQWMLIPGEPLVSYSDGFFRVNVGDVMIISKSYRKTQTPYDPELRDRYRYPSNQRRPYFPAPSRVEIPQPIPDPLPNAGP